MRKINPQPGFQTNYLSSDADIIIGGGSAGGGKTFALLLDPLRYVRHGKFGAVIFRRTTTQVANEGGLWDTSGEIYPKLGARSREYRLEWNFPSGAKIKFAHLEHEKNKLDWQGSQIPYLGFDELTHFTETQFFYLLSRNRSASGVPPCVRATCNPDPDSWVAEFLEWWIDQETGFPIEERNGVVRYFFRDSDNMLWGSTKSELIEKYPDLFSELESKNPGVKPEDYIKSATFVRGSIYENQKLLKVNPGYLADLMALGEEEKQRMLEGNWKIRLDGMQLYQFDKIKDLFSNHAEGGTSFITCDAARRGRDLCVAKLWDGWQVKRIEIMTKSDIDEIIEMLEKLRAFGKVCKSNVLIDQDGVGGGVVDVGKYKGFSAGGTVLADPATRIKENYANLKTQCIYRMANRVNEGSVSVSLDDVWVDGRKTDKVKIGANYFPVKKLITEDLRSFKIVDPDNDKKKRVADKDKQKAALGGRSPDFGDTFMMREWFELRPRVRVLV